MKGFLTIILFFANFSLTYAITFKEFVYDKVLPVLDQIGQMLVALTVLIFFANIYKTYTTSSGGEGKKKLAETIGWGLVIIFVMVSVWGILAMLRNIVLTGRLL